jgi:hypothetical protein
MTTRPPSRLALSLLQRHVPDSEPLAGDLVEQFAERPSQLWLWYQVLAAIAAARGRSGGEIRPLHLVEQQPLDAIERTREVQRLRRDVSPSSHPLPAGLGLILVGGLVTALAPVVWWGLLLTFAGGLVLARVLIAVHRRQAQPSMARRLT